MFDLSHYLTWPWYKRWFFALLPNIKKLQHLKNHTEISSPAITREILAGSLSLAYGFSRIFGFADAPVGIYGNVLLIALALAGSFWFVSIAIGTIIYLVRGKFSMQLIYFSSAYITPLWILSGISLFVLPPELIMVVFGLYGIALNIISTKIMVEVGWATASIITFMAIGLYATLWGLIYLVMWVLPFPWTV